MHKFLNSFGGMNDGIVLASESECFVGAGALRAVRPVVSRRPFGCVRRLSFLENGRRNFLSVYAVTNHESS